MSDDATTPSAALKTEIAQLRAEMNGLLHAIAVIGAENKSLKRELRVGAEMAALFSEKLKAKLTQGAR